MRKNLFIIVTLLLTIHSYAQKIPLKDVLKQGQPHYAILDTTGITDRNDLDNLLAIIKDQKDIRDVLLVSGSDSNNTSLRSKLAWENILIAGLFIKDNTIWKAFNGGVYTISKQKSGTFPPNVGLKSIGDNPFGNGKSVVFTSNTIAGLKKILSFGESEKSFYAVIDDKIVESLNLNRKFNLDDSGGEKTIENVSLDKAIEDVNFYFNTVQSVHPQLLKNLTADDYLKMKKTILDTLAALDKNKELTAADISILLAGAAAKFKDGHTYVIPTYKDLTKVKMPPFRLNYSDGRLFIGKTSKDYSAYSGCEILKIDQKTPAEFLQPSLSLVPGESDNYRMMRFTGEQDKYLAVKNIFDLKDFSATLRMNNGEVSDIKFVPVNFTDYQDIPAEEIKVNDSYFEFLNDGATAYFQYNQFVVNDQQKSLIDSLFKMIDLNKTKDLILDLRFNGGGNSSMGDYILDYITSKPYRMTARSEVKISKELLKMGGYSTYKELEGMLISFPREMKTPEDRGHKFTGRTILLTSINTFSSACMFTEVIKDFHLGTIIGSETGGMRQAFGDILNFNTPNFNIQFGVSHKIFYAPVPQPGDESHGTMPDIEVNDETLKSYKNSRDPILDFTLNYIAKQNL